MEAAMGPRQAHRAATTARIKGLALEQLAQGGAGDLSLRAIARDLGMVSSAIYRYYASRDDLLTALIVDAYGDLAATLEAEPDGAAGFADRCQALRRWALAQPHRFALIYGSVIPGYAAPQSTVEPAVRVARALAAPLAVSPATAVEPAQAALAEHEVPPPLAAGSRALAEALGTPAPGALDRGLSPARALAVVAALARLIGALTLELGGHFIGTFDDAGPLYDELVRREAAALGLTS